MKRLGRTPFLANGWAGRKAAGALPRAWAIVDQRLPDPLDAVARAPRGAAVILRQYQDPRRAALALALARLCRAERRLFLVASDQALALRVRADGLHLPEYQSARAAALKRRHPCWIVSVAAHGLGALRRGRGADLVLISPVFPTRSHPGAATLGPVRFAALARAARRQGLAALALGGMTGRTHRRLSGSGAIGYAGIDAFAGEKA